MSTLPEECKGCYGTNIGCLLVYNEQFAKKCPCNKCLVKMVCDDLCEIRKVVYDSISDEDKTDLEYKQKQGYENRHD